MIHINRLAWFDKAECPIDMLKQRLTVYQQDVITKEITPVTLWEETDSHIGVPRQYVVGRFPEQIRQTDVKWQPIAFPPFRGALFPEQQRGIRAFSEGLRESPLGGILQARCGSGKTVAALYLAAQFGVKTLVLVHKSDLMKQWHDAITKFLAPEKIGMVRQDVCSYDAPVTLAMLATLYARLPDFKSRGFFDEFSLAIFDETHHLPCKTMEAVARQFTAKLRIGLSATPRRKDGLDNVLFWTIGPVIAKMEGRTVTGKFIQVHWKGMNLSRLQNNMSRAITVLSRDPTRNLFIVQQVCKAAEAGRRVLVLTDRIAHAKELEAMTRRRLLANTGSASVSLYIGEMQSSALEAAKKHQVLFGSFGLFSEGTDLPALDTLFFATPRGDVEQMVGRIQRLCDGKKEPLIVDIADHGAGLFLGLARKRERLYLKLGFKPVERETK